MIELRLPDGATQLASSFEFVDNFNFLGINLNKHLNWNPHVKIESNKLVKTVGVLNILKKTHIT